MPKKAPDLLDPFKHAGKQRLAAVISRLTEELAADKILTLATKQASLVLYHHPTRISGKGGLGAASKCLEEFVVFVKEFCGYPEIDRIRPLMGHSSLREMVLCQSKHSAKLKSGTGIEELSWTITLLYVFAVTEAYPDLKDYPSYKILEDTGVVGHLRDLLFDARMPSEITPLEERRREADTAAYNWLCKKIFGVSETSPDPVLRYFGVDKNNASHFICYRYTTRQKITSRTKNLITKSSLTVSFDSQRNRAEFIHVYHELEEVIPRRTTGAVIKLPEAFYFLGASSKKLPRGQEEAAGFTVVAVPSAVDFSLHNRHFLFGLYLANDSALNPIVGKLLLVRAGRTTSPPELEPYRIEEEALLDDLSQFTVESHLRRSDLPLLLKAMKNWDPNRAKVQSAILAAKRQHSY